MLHDEIERIKARHRARPDKLRKGKSWMCKCQAINLYEQEVCKMIQVQIDKFLEKVDQAACKNAGLIEPKPKPVRQHFRHNKTERSERAKLLEIFTGPLRGDD